MPTPVERIAARLAFWHARAVYRRFRNSLGDVEAIQQRVLQGVLAHVAGSDYARRYALGSVRSPRDLIRAAPLVSYEDIRPEIDRLRAGDIAALFSPRQQLVMFATSSGTTAQPKFIPVTPEFVRQYRRGWNTFGLKMLSDHPRAVLRAILQSSGRFDESYTPSGVPCGAITGLMARTQKRIVRRFYVGRPEFALIADPPAKYYTLMRFAVLRDVAFAITANPATLIRMAETADQQSEHLIRDVRDGTLARQIVSDPTLRRRLAAGLKPAPARARELERLRSRHQTLRPRDYWQLDFLACWTAGSMSYYLDRLESWWGPLPVRDIGLLASEGRVTIPLEDGNPAGVLDTQAAVFEFIPREELDHTQPKTLTATDLETEHDYAVVMTNAAGLIRYRLDDVVRVRGWIERAPLLEFLHRAGGIASVAGEKLTENQVVEAVRVAAARLRLPEFDFVLAPQWQDFPFYRLTCSLTAAPELAEEVDKALGEQNEEYHSRRKSLRLGSLQVRTVDRASIVAMDQRLMAARKCSSEQYKRRCLLTEPGEDDKLLGLAR